MLHNEAADKIAKTQKKVLVTQLYLRQSVKYSDINVVLEGHCQFNCSPNVKVQETSFYNT